ncbi:MAG: filamentous hemagglutinin family protein, partial [Clostridia bacterium]|nr:filamentous hemagglutinin family protein [Clostridia bacterium]
MILKFKVVGGAMGRIDHNTIAADTVGTVYAEFDVDDVWAGMSAIKAIFTRTEGGPSYIALLGNDRKCTVPHEVMASEGYFNVGLIGIGPGNVLVRTTSVLRAVYVAAAAPVDGSPDPTPSELE